MNEKVAVQLVEHQDKQISKLLKEIETLRAENKQLKELLENSMSLAQPLLEEISDEEIIASGELKKLKELSQQQILTYEECKKVVEYSKILQSKKKKNNDNEELKKLSAEDLLKELL